MGYHGLSQYQKIHSKECCCWLFAPAPVAPLVQPDDLNEAWVQFCQETAQPCYNYFRKEVMTHSCINIYRATRLCNPEAMKTVPKNAAAVRELVRVLQPKILSDELIT